MSASPETIQTVRQWVEKAEHDLRAAEQILKLEADCPYDTICFHAQQCAEKYLKALLAFHSVAYPKTHDLSALYYLMPKDLELELRREDLTDLSRFSVEARYPGNFSPIEREEAEAAVAAARQIRTLIRARLSLNVFSG